MSQLIPTILLIGVSIALFLIGMYYQQQKGLYISVGGAILLMLIGITLFANPMESQTGETAYLNTTTNTTITTNTYTPINTFQNNIFATILTIVGLAGIMIPTTMINNKQYDEE